MRVPLVRRGRVDRVQGSGENSFWEQQGLELELRRESSPDGRRQEDSA